MSRTISPASRHNNFHINQNAEVFICWERKSWDQPLLALVFVLGQGMMKDEVVLVEYTAQFSSCHLTECKLPEGRHYFFVTTSLPLCTSVVAQSIQLCPTLRDPVDHALHGVFLAQTLEWFAISFPSGLK